MKKVYLMKDNNNNLYKIGVSNNPQKRLKTFQTGNAGDVELIYEIECDSPHIVEGTLHKYFRTYKVKNEWFDLDNEVVNNFKNLCLKVNSNIKYLSQYSTLWNK